MGTQGAQGAQGTLGTQGAQGALGTQGAQGTLGSTGSQGTQGTLGTQGTQGTLGTQGAQGTLGTQGTQGSGTQGIQGIQGLQGITGTGVQGIQGIQGIAGAGSTGTSLNIANTLVARNANGDFAAGKIELSGSGSTTVPQLNLNGATNNWIGFNSNGFAPPSSGVRSIGTKLVLYPNIPAFPDYAMGIEADNFWVSLPSAGQGFKWYGGTGLAATLVGNGNFTTIGTVQGTRLISTIPVGTAPLTVTSTTVVPNLNSSLLQGYATATTNTIDTIIRRDSSGDFSARTATLTSITIGNPITTGKLINARSTSGQMLMESTSATAGYVFSYVGGRAGALVAGTQAAIFLYDSLGGFGIGKQDNVGILTNPAGGGATYYFWMDSNGNISINNSITSTSDRLYINGDTRIQGNLNIINAVGVNNKGVLFGTGTGALSDVGFTRLSSGVLKVSDGGAGHGTLNAGFFSGDGRLLTNLVHAKNLSYFTALDNTPPVAGFATLDTRNSIPVLNFDAALNESGIFQGVIPTGSNLISGIKVNIEWMALTGILGNVVWGARFENATHDLDADSFDIFTTGLSTTNGTAGIISTLSLNCTAIDSITQGDSFRLNIIRSGSHASDTLAGDAQLLYVDLLTIA